MIIRTAVAFLLMLLASISSAGDRAPFALEFDVARNGKALGEARLSLEKLSQDVWLFRTHTQGTEGLAGLAGVDIDERSEFRWVDGRPETLNYAFDQKVSFKSKSRALNIRPESQSVDWRDDDGRQSLSYEPGLLDRNLVVLALLTDVERAVEKAEYRIADKGKIDTNEYRVVGTETLKTARGAMEAVRVERIRSRPGRQTTIWIAASIGHLPVRIQQIEPDGDTLDMTLR